ncbi:hypothetical protein [Nocardioides stalactiti]|uniref:hypothetical protein n=1 Tax=Nocardioides stalactiti TaxID=2755356 RepID=UPI001602B78C|nr:hypothetical protein [Nocardioides stalactiti]
MSDQVTDQETVLPAGPASERTPVPWRAWGAVAGALLVAGAALGGLGGWLWYQWWGPPNKGSIFDTTAYGITWFDTTDKGIAQDFAGTGEYVVIGFGLGLVLGTIAAFVGRRHAFAALAALLAGAALAAALSWAVGTMLSPPDPQKFATEANVCTELPCKEYPAAIEVNGWTPYLLWPIGALTGFCATTFLLGTFVEVRRQQHTHQQAGTWLERGGPADA